MKPWIAMFALLVACNGGKTPPEAAGDEGAKANTEEPAPEGDTIPKPGTEHVEPADPDTPNVSKEEVPDMPTDEAFGDGYWLVAEPAPTVENNVFKAIARHGGGCAEHEFTLHKNGVGRSKPPTALLTLHHNANGDRCRALLVTPLEIDLNEVLADMGCIGRVSIGVPPAQDASAAGGALIFDIDPVNCE